MVGYLRGNVVLIQGLPLVDVYLRGNSMSGSSHNHDLLPFLQLVTFSFSFSDQPVHSPKTEWTEPLYLTPLRVAQYSPPLPLEHFCPCISHHLHYLCIPHTSSVSNHYAVPLLTSLDLSLHSLCPAIGQVLFLLHCSGLLSPSSNPSSIPPPSSQPLTHSSCSYSCSLGEGPLAFSHLMLVLQLSQSWIHDLIVVQQNSIFFLNF